MSYDSIFKVMVFSMSLEFLIYKSLTTLINILVLIYSLIRKYCSSEVWTVGHKITDIMNNRLIKIIMVKCSFTVRTLTNYKSLFRVNNVQRLKSSR